MSTGNNKTYEQFGSERTMNAPPPNYTGQQMNYLQNQPVPQVVVQPTAQLQTFSVETAQTQWSWCHLVTSMIAFFCCTIFGFIATIMSVLSYVDHNSKQYERAKSKKNVALGFGIAGIVIGSITFLIVIIVVSLTANAAVETFNENYNHDNY